jgi:hypothetical protein
MVLYLLFIRRLDRGSEFISNLNKIFQQPSIEIPHFSAAIFLWIPGFVLLSFTLNYFSKKRLKFRSYTQHIFLENLLNPFIHRRFFLLCTVTLFAMLYKDNSLFELYLLIYYLLLQDLLGIALNCFGNWGQAIDRLIRGKTGLRFHLLLHNLAYSLVFTIMLLPLNFLIGLVNQTILTIHILFQLHMLFIHLVFGNWTSVNDGFYSNSFEKGGDSFQSNIFRQIIIISLLFLDYFLIANYSLTLSVFLLLSLLAFYFPSLLYFSNKESLLKARNDFLY